MPLDTALMTTVLSHSCPHCGARTERTGAWFRARTAYSCTGCEASVPMTYLDKIRLFARHAPPQLDLRVSAAHR